MKKTLVVLLAIVAVSAVGCKKKEEAPKAVAPEAGSAAQSSMPAVPAGTNPHAGLKAQEIKPGAGHKGKVVETMNAAGYTYVQVEENGQKLWVAVMETPVKVGDTVEFPDSPPMINFSSKTLKRTFDKIIFAPGLAITQ